MKLKTLSGKQISIDVRTSQYPMRTESSCRSKIQYAVGQAIKEKYPFDPILEDIPIDGFYFDFFLPRRKIAIEVQGRQHDEFVPFFHKNKRGFIQSKERDNRKAEFCRINDIKLCLIYDIEDVENV